MEVRARVALTMRRGAHESSHYGPIVITCRGRVSTLKYPSTP